MKINNKVDLTPYAKLTDITGKTEAAYGSYVGNSTVDRAIEHGLGRTPKMVLICMSNAQYWGRIMGVDGKFYGLSATGQGQYNLSAPDETDFHVGHNTSYTYSCNLNGWTYYWVAIG